MKAGIIGAMEQEISLLRDEMDNHQTLKTAGCEIYTGRLHGEEVALLKSGIGKVSAALGTTLLLEHCKPDVIINTGSAGGLSSSLNVGDIVLSDEVRYHDVDVTAFGYQPGQMAGCPAAFYADKTLLSVAERTTKKMNLTAVKGMVVSGDTFVNGSQPLARLHDAFPLAVAVEMEATAIAHVCHQFGVPFIVIRAISDLADRESHLSFDEFLPVAARQSSRLVKALLAELKHA